MEALALAAVGYLVKAIKDNKALDSFQNDFIGATVDWIRPIFLVEDKESEDLTDLKEAPDDADNQAVVKSKIQKHLKKNPESAEKLQAIIDKLKAADVPPATITMTHYGSGDNVGGNKIVNG